MHQKLQFCHLTHFYYGVASQVWDTITTHIESIPIAYNCVINDTSAKKIPYESLRAITFEKPLCTKSLLLDYLFLLRFCPSFFFFYRPAFVPSESTETNSIFLYYPVPTHTQRISHSSIFMTKRKPPFLLGFLFVARIYITHHHHSRPFLSTFDLYSAVNHIYFWMLFNYRNFQLERTPTSLLLLLLFHSANILLHHRRATKPFCFCCC